MDKFKSNVGVSPESKGKRTLQWFFQKQFPVVRAKAVPIESCHLRQSQGLLAMNVVHTFSGKDGHKVAANGTPYHWSQLLQLEG